jgi:hypothetical protein
LLHIGSDFVTGRGGGGGRDAEDVSELHPVQVLGRPLQRVRVGSKVAQPDCGLGVLRGEEVFFFLNQSLNLQAFDGSTTFFFVEKIFARVFQFFLQK